MGIFSFISCNDARQVQEIKSHRCIVVEKPSQLRLVDVVHAHLQSVAAAHRVEIIAKLPFLLVRLLGYVLVRTEINLSRKKNCWGPFLRIDEVVPILIT